jgi:predicted HicB family RNase H-like nuclease
MGQINVEIPDELHDELREMSAEKQIPQNLIVTESIHRFVTNWKTESTQS